MKPWKASIWAALLLIVASVASAGNESIDRIQLLNGSTITGATRTAWFPVRGANRIIIQTWSNLGGAVGSGDSIYSDSLVAVEVFFSDSMQSTNPLIAGDSIIINCTTVSTVDSSKKMVAVQAPPLMEPLSPTATGGGSYMLVLPILPATVAIYGDGSILPTYMAVQVRPYKRRVITGSTDSTQGVKGLKMAAQRIWKNR